MNKINIFLKIVLSLILIMPIIGSLGIFPPPTREMYGSDEAFAFMMLLMNSKYIVTMMAVIFILVLVSIWTNRILLAAILLLPISLNIVGFHAFLDMGLFTGGAVMGNVLLLINLYMLWQSRVQLKNLLLSK